MNTKISKYFPVLKELFHSQFKKSIILTLLFLLVLLTGIQAQLNWLKIQKQKQAVNSLEVILSITLTHLNFWTEERLNYTGIWARNPKLLKLTKKILQEYKEGKNLVQSPTQTEIRDFFKDKLAFHKDLGIFLIAPDRTSVASMRDKNIGTRNLIDIHHKKTLDTIFKGYSKFIPPIISDVTLSKSSLERDITMFVAHPIYDHGKVIAVFTVRLDTQKNFDMLTQMGQIELSGETYAIDEKGLLLSQSRFDEQLKKNGLLKPIQKSNLNIYIKDPGVNLTLGEKSKNPKTKWPLTHMAKNLTQKKTGSSYYPYNDYRGVPVIGAWTWDYYLDIGIASEIDLEETLHDFYVLRKFIYIVYFIFCVIIFGFLSVYFYQKTKSKEKLQAKEQKYQNLFQNNAAAICLYNKDSDQIISANKAFYKLYKISPNEKLKPCHCYWIEIDKKSYQKEASNIDTSSGKELHLKHNEEAFYANVFRGSYIENNQVINYAIIEDITEQQKMEYKILEQKRQLEEAIEVKNKFLGLVAHDLRNPISSIKSYSQLLSQAKLDENQKSKIIVQIEKSSEKMLSLIENILDVSRYEMGKIKPKYAHFNLRSIVTSQIQSLDFNLSQKKIIIKNDVPTDQRVYADPVMIAECIHNFLTNAIKFSSIGGQIKVFTTSKNPTIISISDQGKGIPKEKIPLLFKYEENTSTIGTAGEAGTGLGLPLVNDIIKSHNGSIKVDSEIGKGSTFTIELPYQKPKIWLIDDEEMTHKTVSSFMSKIECELISIQDAKNINEILKKQKPDLIISDIYMDNYNIFQFLDQVQKDMKHIPFVVITSTKDIKLREKLLNKGALDLFVKPLSAEEFIPKIKNLIG